MTGKTVQLLSGLMVISFVRSIDVKIRKINTENGLFTPFFGIFQNCKKFPSADISVEGNISKCKYVFRVSPNPSTTGTHLGKI